MRRVAGVVGGDGCGHAPGTHFTKAVDDPVPVGLWANGLHVQTVRTVFDSGQGEVGAATCPLCRTEIRLVDEVWEPIESAWDPFEGWFRDWAEEGGEGFAHCPSCALPSGIDRWTRGGRLLRVRAPRVHVLGLGGTHVRFHP
ncbi:hypothetical protein [Streptomyces sp. NPDC001787]|uniref:hypothetical protein n=1 Tax=Streptomyces sp. NPDC001787 TaxID=3154523 RepID=UPI00332FD72E